MRLILALASILLLSGCANLPVEFAKEMKRASAKYASVTGDMSRADVIARLGAPQKDYGSKAIWEIRFDWANYDALAVTFGDDGRITWISRSHGRGAYGPNWRAQRSYVFEQ